MGSGVSAPHGCWHGATFFRPLVATRRRIAVSRPPEDHRGRLTHRSPRTRGGLQMACRHDNAEVPVGLASTCSAPKRIRCDIFWMPLGLGRTNAGNLWWYSFIFAGKSVQEFAHTHRKTECVRPPEVIAEYLDGYAAGHAAKSVERAKGRLAVTRRHPGSDRLPDATERRIRQYITDRTRKVRRVGR